MSENDPNPEHWPEEHFKVRQINKLDPLFSSAKTGGTDDWATPQWLYNKICQVANYGQPFNLDPCADGINAKCEKFYTIADDGLKQPWAPYKTFFVNPPYSDIKKWTKKTYDESQMFTEYTDNGVLLIPARTDTTWWHDYVTKAREIFFLRGRVKFGDSKNSAPFPSAVIIFGKRDADKPLVHFVDWRTQ